MKKEEKLSYGFVNPGIMWLFVVVGIILISYLPINNKIFDRNPLTIFLFVICFLYWVYLLSASLKVHEKIASSVRKIDKIITKGPL
jgi:hypothetical protein